MRHTTISMLAVAVFTLTGCSLSGSGSDKPAAPTSNASAGAAQTEQIAECRDAIVASKNDSADNGLPQCTKLSPDDYLKALKEADKQGQKAVHKATDEASASTQP
jgi:hypothetical protein